MVQRPNPSLTSPINSVFRQLDWWVGRPQTSFRVHTGLLDTVPLRDTDHSLSSMIGCRPDVVDR